VRLTSRGPGAYNTAMPSLPPHRAAPAVSFRPRPRPLLAFAAVLFAASSAAAHPISVSQENVFVARDKVVVTMQVFAEDLYFFHDLRPDDLNVISHADLKEAVPKHAEFLRNRVRLIDADGNLLEGRTTQIDDAELEPPGFKVPELAYKKLAFTMEYPLDAPPQFLTFAQEIVGADAGFPSEVQLNVKQAGNPLEESRTLKPGAPFTMRFEWEDAPPTDAANEAEREAWLEAQREKTLGITDYGTAYSFLYVTDRGVRHEILIPFVTLESFFIVDRGKRAFLEVDEQAAAKEQIAEFFRTANPVEIDGVPVTPIVDRVEFFEVGFQDFAQQRGVERVATANSRVGVILSYPAKNPPEQVHVTWDQWSRQLLEVRAVGFAYEERLSPVFSKIERSETFEWSSPGRPATPPITTVEATLFPPPPMRLPVVSVGCVLLAVPMLLAGLFVASARRWIAGAIVLGVVALLTIPFARVAVANPFDTEPRVPIERSHPIVRTLVGNMYRAFDYQSESDVYDALAHSIDGDLLRKTYLRVHQSLAMQDQGGAISLVDKVVVQNGEKLPLPADSGEEGPGFAYRCSWTVEGTVEHWGHVHSRTNLYTALLTIRRRDGDWKITGLEILDEQRVGTRTSLRRF
jgi:hypothetical protein